MSLDALAAEFLTAAEVKDLTGEAKPDAEAAEQAGNATLAESLRRMFLRDMRKMASDLADSDEDASKLLQHGSVDLTRKHYRTRAATLKPVR